MSQEFENITVVHEVYKHQSDRWRYLLQSFIGGDAYRRGRFLTRYMYESDSDYAERIDTTPLDNHCKSVIQVYNAFLFRDEPEREFGSLIQDSSLESFLEDADLEGRSLNAFMKDAATYSSVFGHSWILVTKPNTNAKTRAEELAQEVRPYVSLLTPLAVLDWHWKRAPNGVYYLSYFKYREDSDDSRYYVIKEWYEDRIVTTEIDGQRREVQSVITEENGLGTIPAVIVYSQRSTMRGLGVSDIQDISDQQRSIYNEYSEIEQAIRLSGHPSLVKTADVEAIAGAGAIIQMPENMDPGLKPYLLEPGQQNVDAIYTSVTNRINSIDRMANLGSVRVTQAREMSGIAMQTEFQMLNARLSEKADNLELAEEQMWRFYARYQNLIWDGTVHYEDDYNIKDNGRELSVLNAARTAATDPAVLRMIDYKIVEVLGKSGAEVLTYTAERPISGRTYPDGQAIDPNLPAAYVSADTDGVPPGQNCSNCENFNSISGLCSKFDAPVRGTFWCAKWDDNIQ
jgi:hypothetical protein